jgi:hypothetical protein
MLVTLVCLRNLARTEPGREADSGHLPPSLQLARQNPGDDSKQGQRALSITTTLPGDSRQPTASQLAGYESGTVQALSGVLLINTGKIFP